MGLRKYLFALLSVALTLAALEALARAGDAALGRPLEMEDPFVGFYGLHPLFVPDPDDPTFLRTNPRKLDQGIFRNERFPASKAPDTYRVFCFGGSVTWGYGIGGQDSIVFSYPKRLEKVLAEQAQALRGSRRFEVINCGANGYASYRILQLVKEVVRLEPDLILISCGQNETDEPLFYRRLIERDPRLIELQRLLYRSRAFLALKRAVFEVQLRFAGPSEGGEDRTDPRTLDMFGKPMLPEENVKWEPTEGAAEQIGTLVHYEHSLAEMVRIVRDAGAEIAIFRLPRQEDGFELRGCEVLPRIWAGEAARAKIGAQRLLELEIGPRGPAARGNQQLIDLYHALAVARGQLGEIEGAACAWDQAKRLGHPGLGMLEELNTILSWVSLSMDVPLIDPIRAFEQDAIARGDYLMRDLFVDSVHPSRRGYRLMAEAALETLEREVLPGGSE